MSTVNSLYSGTASRSKWSKLDRSVNSDEYHYAINVAVNGCAILFPQPDVTMLTILDLAPMSPLLSSSGSSSVQSLKKKAAGLPLHPRSAFT